MPERDHLNGTPAGRPAVTGPGGQATPAAIALQVKMRALYKRVGTPGSRPLAAKARYSHAVVNDIVRGRSLGTWTSYSAVVRALGGSPAEFRDLWAQARFTVIPPDAFPDAGDATIRHLAATPGTTGFERRALIGLFIGLRATSGQHIPDEGNGQPDV